MQAIVSVNIKWTGGSNFTYGGEICKDVGGNAQACLSRDFSNQQKDGKTITGSGFSGSLKVGSPTETQAKLSIGFREEEIKFTTPPKNSPYSIFISSKQPSDNSQYIMKKEDNSNPSFFKCATLPETKDGKPYQFETTKEGNAVVVSNTQGEKATCPLSSKP
jgi:hypothetical protein